MGRILALVLLTAWPSISQENVLSSYALEKADVVVLGTLYRDFSFPWFDGWNERGHIKVEQVLKGDIRETRSLRFAWERDFRQGWCLTRPDWRGAIGKSGIWVLTKDSGQYR